MRQAVFMFDHVRQLLKQNTYKIRHLLIFIGVAGTLRVPLFPKTPINFEIFHFLSVSVFLKLNDFTDKKLIIRFFIGVYLLF